jgi:hypothetical protein
MWNDWRYSEVVEFALHLSSDLETRAENLNDALKDCDSGEAMMATIMMHRLR